MEHARSSREVKQDLARARQVVSVVGDERLREQVLGSSAENATAPRFDWIGRGGEIDEAALRRSANVLRRLMLGEGILAFDRLHDLPSTQVERSALSERIVRQVFDRLGNPTRIGEDALSAAILMLCSDPATVRRDCVDSGILARSSDGSWYRLVA